MGPIGPAGTGCDIAYGGIFNTGAGEFCTQPGEIAAMTFSGYLPAAGIRYDGNHSMVLENDGVYEIHYSLRGNSKNRSQLCIAVTNDGVTIPCSRVCKDCAANSDIDLSCVAVTEARAGAHLHLVAYLMLYAKKLGGLPGSDPDPSYGYERRRGREYGFDRERDYDRERDHDRFLNR
jgi:hypothetical protein